MMDITTVLEVPLSDIKLQGTNVRSDLETPNSKENIVELAENIKINGLLQPIVLRGEFGKPPYDVIVGQRRYLAHLHLGEENIKATFSGEIDDTNALLLSLSENMCRQEMNYEDISNAITTLYKHYGNDEYQVQKHTGFSIRMIRGYVKIDAHATEKIKLLIKENKISLSDAKRAIDASQGDKEKADVLIDELVKLSKYEKKRLVESGINNPSAKADELIATAKQPKLEETIILNLPRKVHKALLEAAEKLSIDVEELTVNTLVNWLKTNDYLIES
jgi:ParB family chromosome partitioning protein